MNQAIDPTDDQEAAAPLVPAMGPDLRRRVARNDEWAFRWAIVQISVAAVQLLVLIIGHEYRLAAAVAATFVAGQVADRRHMLPGTRVSADTNSSIAVVRVALYVYIAIVSPPIYVFAVAMAASAVGTRMAERYRRWLLERH